MCTDATDVLILLTIMLFLSFSGACIARLTIVDVNHNNWIGCNSFYLRIVKPGCQMSPMIGESLSVIIQREIHKEFYSWKSPTMVVADFGDI